MEKFCPMLSELNEGIFITVMMCDDETVEIIFNASGSVKTISPIEDLVKAAPRIPGWKFTALSSPNYDNDLEISFGGYSFNYDNIFFMSMSIRTCLI
jgi:hypothetical protein